MGCDFAVKVSFTSQQARPDGVFITACRFGFPEQFAQLLRFAYIPGLLRPDFPVLIPNLLGIKPVVMRNKIILGVTLLVILLACNDEDPDVPQKTSLLTLSVDASYLTDISDNWIIVHDENGALLASQSFETNQELEIVTDKPVPGKITITHLRYSTLNGTKFYLATSHANIEKGRHMILEVPSVIPSQETGKLNVTVTDVASYDHFAVSTASYGASWNGGTRVLDLETSTYADFPNHIITIGDGNTLKHKIVSNVKPNDSHSFSFYDMNPFDQTVDFNFPQPGDVILSVNGVEPGKPTNDHFLLLHLGAHKHNTIKAGYLNILTNYRTRLDISYPDYAYEYRKLGSVPDGNIVWPQKSDFTINEKAFVNFSATTLKSYLWRYSTWSYYDAASQVVFNWDVSSSLGNQFIKDLPAEITSAHPAISLSNLKHASTTFYTQSPAFESYVDWDFKVNPEPTGTRLGIKIITN